MTDIKSEACLFAMVLFISQSFGFGNTCLDLTGFYRPKAADLIIHKLQRLRFKNYSIGFCIHYCLNLNSIVEIIPVFAIYFYIVNLFESKSKWHCLSLAPSTFKEFNCTTKWHSVLFVCLTGSGLCNFCDEIHLKLLVLNKFCLRIKMFI